MLLSLCSPVLHKTICGDFSEGRAKRLELDDVDAGSFGSLLDAWCGRTGLEAKELGDLMALAGLADRFEMTEVQGGLEEAIIGRLSVGTCADVLTRSGGLGLRRVEAAAERMVVEGFEEVAGTEGFMGLEEEALRKVLEDEGLGVRSEERAYEGLVRWMMGGKGGGGCWGR